ncbi:MAG: riboflavin synthase subunit alpha [Pseudomonadales bacterium]
MFTGIVQGLATVKSVEERGALNRLTLTLPAQNSENFQLGASIAVAGTCLTITGFKGQDVSFDVIAQTLKVTNLGQLRTGEHVNFERAARFSDEIGGHLISGHIGSTVSISDVIHTPNNCQIWFNTPATLSKYIMDKGFIGLNGCSLTIAEVEQARFCVHLIPETLSITTFGTAAAGDRVNIEIDHQTQTIVDTVERVLAHQNS